MINAEGHWGQHVNEVVFLMDEQDVSHLDFDVQYRSSGILSGSWKKPKLDQDRFKSETTAQGSKVTFTLSSKEGMTKFKEYVVRVRAKKKGDPEEEKSYTPWSDSPNWARFRCHN